MACGGSGRLPPFLRQKLHVALLQVVGRPSSLLEGLQGRVWETVTQRAVTGVGEGTQPALRSMAGWGCPHLLPLASGLPPIGG